MGSSTTRYIHMTCSIIFTLRVCRVFLVKTKLRKRYRYRFDNASNLCVGPVFPAPRQQRLLFFLFLEKIHLPEVPSPRRCFGRDCCTSSASSSTRACKTSLWPEHQQTPRFFLPLTSIPLLGRSGDGLHSQHAAWCYWHFVCMLLSFFVRSVGNHLLGFSQCSIASPSMNQSLHLPYIYKFTIIMGRPIRVRLILRMDPHGERREGALASNGTPVSIWCEEHMLGNY